MLNDVLVEPDDRVHEKAIEMLLGWIYGETYGSAFLKAEPVTTQAAILASLREAAIKLGLPLLRQLACDLISVLLQTHPFSTDLFKALGPRLLGVYSLLQYGKNDGENYDFVTAQLLDKINSLSIGIATDKSCTEVLHEFPQLRVNMYLIKARNVQQTVDARRRANVTPGNSLSPLIMNTPSRRGLSLMTSGEVPVG